MVHGNVLMDDKVSRRMCTVVGAQVGLRTGHACTEEPMPIHTHMRACDSALKMRIDPWLPADLSSA